MNGSDIIDALNNIDDWMIQDAKQHIRIAPVWLRWGSVAVCFCCICILGVFCIKNYLNFHLVEISPGAMTSVEEAHTNEFAASVDLPEDHGDTQEPLIWRYPDDYDLGDCAEYTADGTTLKWFDPVSNEVMEGGGFIWQLTAIPIDDFNSREKDAESEAEDGWFDYITYNQYMFGKNENYVYVLSLPGDVQYNSQSETSYNYYTEIGIEVLDDIVLLNNMERNPSWYAPEMFPWAFSTLSSVQYPVSLTVPKEYEEHIIVDSTFYYDYNVSYGFEGEDLGSVEGDAIFSFYVDYNDNDQIHGLVWSITVEPRYDYDEKFDYGELADLNQVLNYTVLGSDDMYTYLLIHCGETGLYCYDNSSISAVEIYLNYTQDSVAMIADFIFQNEITEDPQWLQRFTTFTLQDTEGTFNELLRADKLASEVPLLWEYTGPYKLDTCVEFSEDGKKMTFFDPVTRTSFGDGSSGKIWWIDILTNDEFDKRIAEDMIEETEDGFWYGRMYTNAYMYAVGSDVVYVLNSPTDLQYDPNDPESKTSYLRYMDAGLTILESIITLNGLTVNPNWDDDEIRFLFRELFLTDETLLNNNENLDISDYTYTLSNFVSQLTMDDDRNGNITLTCKAIDGTILVPGKSFSFDDIVGERAMGGGVSQVASKLTEI